MTLRDHINSITQDAVLWQCMKYWRTALSTIDQQNATKDIVELLCVIPTQIKRDTYVKSVCEEVAKWNRDVDKKIAQTMKDHKALQRKLDKADEESRGEILELRETAERNMAALEETLLPELAVSDLKKYVANGLDAKEKEKKAKQKTIFDNNGDYNPDQDWDLEEGDPWNKCPKWINKAEVQEDGFSFVNVTGANGIRYGYYSYNPNEKSSVQITNFSISPIFHVLAENPKDSQHLLEVNNGKISMLLKVESKAMVSIDVMQLYLVGKGNFLIFGSKTAWLRIASKLLDLFRACYEIRILGWQQYGFYAFVNKIFIPGKGLMDYDKWGVVEVEEKNFFVPPASLLYKKTISTEEDQYLMDRPFQIVETDITFDHWVKKMQRVYPEHKGNVGIAYCIMSCFRDFIFSIDNNFPHLYAYGSTSSGKSKWAESLMALFCVNRPFFQLNSGTDNALFLYGGRFMNGLAGFNEFDVNSIKTERFQQIKGWYDGEGRQRGVMGGHRRQTETVDITSGVVLMGQFLVTADDNSIVNRSVIEPFTPRNLTNEDKQEYEELKSMEKKGITSILLELLDHREYFREHFQKRTNKTLADWRTRYGNGVNFNQRVMQNWSYLYNAIAIAKEKISLSIDTEEFNNYCYARASYWCKFLRTSDSLSEFWNTVMFLSESKLISIGWDYRIEEVSEITLRKEKDETYVKKFNDPVKVLYMRLNNVHKLYQSSYRSRTGKEAMSMESIMHYLSNRDYYIGAVKNFRFTKHGDANQNAITNAYAFIYDDLDINLEVLSMDELRDAMRKNQSTDLPVNEINNFSTEDAPF